MYCKYLWVVYFTSRPTCKWFDSDVLSFYFSCSICSSVLYVGYYKKDTLFLSNTICLNMSQFF